MPIYEYVCQSCGTKFEKFVRSMSPTVAVECPECNGDKVEKAYSVFGLGRSSGASILGGSTASAASCAIGGT